MPSLSAWTVRAALLHLLAGFTLGGLMLANKGQPFWPGAWSLLTAHIELLLVGWTVQFILGIAFWILPRYPGGSRGNERIAVASILLLNLGVGLVAVPGPMFIFAGRLCQLLAGILFLAHAWGRIRPLYQKTA